MFTNPEFSKVSTARLHRLHDDLFGGQHAVRARVDRRRGRRRADDFHRLGYDRLVGII